MTEIGLDDTDRRLIQLLRADARLPAASLAKHLGVSRGTVYKIASSGSGLPEFCSDLQCACAAMSAPRQSAPSPQWRPGRRTRMR
ncbi:MAG: Lrp/AsnC family transcriptional regulator [Alsobacter sp.]